MHPAAFVVAPIVSTNRSSLFGFVSDHPEIPLKLFR